MYFYNTLSANEKIAYNRLYEGYDKQAEKIDLTDLNIGFDRFSGVLKEMVLYDHPEIFWVDKPWEYYSDASTNTIKTYLPKYRFDMEQRRRMQAALLEKEKYFLLGITPFLSPYEKVLKLYENFAYLISYDHDALVGERYENRKKHLDDCYTIYGAIVKKKAVCKGYAKALQYLANKCAVEVITVSGKTASGGRHAWNMMCVNGDWFHLDATWGDKTEDIADGFIAYWWFGLTDQELSRSRTINTDLPYPKATSTHFDYLRINGNYLQSWTPKQLEATVQREIKKNGYKPIQLKFDSVENVKQAWAYLIEKNCIWNIYNECGVEPTSMCHYLCEKAYALAIWTKKPEMKPAEKPMSSGSSSQGSSDSRKPNNFVNIVRERIKKNGYNPFQLKYDTLDKVEYAWAYLEKDDRIYQYYRESGVVPTTVRHNIDKDKCVLTIWPERPETKDSEKPSDKGLGAVLALHSWNEASLTTAALYEIRKYNYKQLRLKFDSREDAERALKFLKEDRRTYLYFRESGVEPTSLCSDIDAQNVLTIWPKQ